MTPKEIIEWHEENKTGITKSRCWKTLKGIVQNTSKFPDREVFRKLAKTMYQKGQKKSIKSICSPSGWNKIINPDIN